MKFTRELKTEYIPEFKKQFRQCGKKAFKIGIEEPSYEISGQRFESISSDGVFGDTYDKYQTVTVSDINTNLGKWKIAAKIRTSNLDVKPIYTAKVINGVYYTFYEDVPENVLKKSPYHCDYCKNDNRRSMYFILKNTESGEYTQISASSLNEFTKKSYAYDFGNILNAIDNILNYQPEFDEHYNQNGDIEHTCWYKTEDILKLAVYVYNKFGWVSSQKAEDAHILSSSDIIKGIIKENRLPNDYDVQVCESEARAVKEYHIKRIETINANESLKKNTNEFFTSVSEHVLDEYIEDKSGDFGILCYAVLTYYENKNVESIKESEYIGKLYTHTKLKCKLLYKNERPAKYGISILGIFDADGNKIKIFTGEHTALGMDFKKAIVGDEYEFEGRISKYDEFNHVKYTTLKNVKIISHYRPKSTTITISSIDEIYNKEVCST